MHVAQIYLVSMPQVLQVKNPESSRKIKLQIGKLVYNQILLDVEDYGLRSPSALYTLLCELALSQEIRADTSSDDLEQETISFTLPPLIAWNFYSVCQKLQVRMSAAVRHLLCAYAAQSRSRREEIVRHVEKAELVEAIRKHKCVSLFYKGKAETLEPCFLAHSQGMARSYLVAFDSQCKDFRCLRLAHIGMVRALSEKASYLNHNALKFRAKDLRNHFDPFLSWNQSVTVRLTAAGAEQMVRATTNRPVCDLNTLREGTHKFQCSPLQAQLYFAAFLNEAEILQPLSLREWFAQKTRLAAELYGAGVSLQV